MSPSRLATLAKAPRRPLGRARFGLIIGSTNWIRQATCTLREHGVGLIFLCCSECHKRVSVGPGMCLTAGGTGNFNLKVALPVGGFSGTAAHGTVLFGFGLQA